MTLGHLTVSGLPRLVRACPGLSRYDVATSLALIRMNVNGSSSTISSIIHFQSELNSRPGNTGIERLPAYSIGYHLGKS